MGPEEGPEAPSGDPAAAVVAAVGCIPPSLSSTRGGMSGEESQRLLLAAYDSGGRCMGGDWPSSGVAAPGTPVAPLPPAPRPGKGVPMYLGPPMPAATPGRGVPMARATGVPLAPAPTLGGGIPLGRTPGVPLEYPPGVLLVHAPGVPLER